MTLAHAVNLPQPRRRVVVLAADEMVRDALACWLGADGADVQVAANGSEAAMLLDQGGTDALVTDRTYPAWTGLGTMQSVKQRFPGIRVVVAGARADDPFVALARSVGADAVIPSPLRKAEVIRSLVGR
ncbi:MAG TPA: response regulator [Candidatus Omnitrophota bacterium]|nr:response regulator [Candidatus Omnitrophota bacterium]